MIEDRVNLLLEEVKRMIADIDAKSKKKSSISVSTPRPMPTPAATTNAGDPSVAVDSMIQDG